MQVIKEKSLTHPCAGNESEVFNTPLCRGVLNERVVFNSTMGNKRVVFNSTMYIGQIIKISDIYLVDIYLSYRFYVTLPMLVWVERLLPHSDQVASHSNHTPKAALPFSSNNSFHVITHTLRG